RRKKFNRGYFMDREEIEKRLGSVADAAQLLSVVPGVNIVAGVGGSVIRISRAAGAFGACNAKGPRIWVDGFLIDTQDLPGERQFYSLSQVVQPEDIYAIEVYRSPSQVPVQYGGPQSGCGLVLIWTARGR
ncbi:MAG: Plug domain-containing protein, partial [Gemmatimonadales bacterium]